MKVMNANTCGKESYDLLKRNIIHNDTVVYIMGIPKMVWRTMHTPRVATSTTPRLTLTIAKLSWGFKESIDPKLAESAHPSILTFACYTCPRLQYRYACRRGWPARLPFRAACYCIAVYAPGVWGAPSQCSIPENDVLQPPIFSDHDHTTIMTEVVSAGDSGNDMWLRPALFSWSETVQTFMAKTLTWKLQLWLGRCL